MSKREGSAKYGRRSTEGSSTIQILSDDLFLHLENESENFHNCDSPDDYINTERKSSAKFGRRSQSSRISVASSMGSISNHHNQNCNSNSNESVNENTFQGRLNLKYEKELLTALEKCEINSEKNSISKNSARYGRRAVKNSLRTENYKANTNTKKLTNNSSSFSYKNCKSKLLTKIPDRKNSITEEINSLNKILEESWKSLIVFNKKHKGRISESKFQ